jgi:hypothetical protein
MRQSRAKDCSLFVFEAETVSFAQGVEEGVRRGCIVGKGASFVLLLSMVLACTCTS